MTKRKVMLRTPKDVTPVSLINSLTCFFAALNQIGATSPNSFLPLILLAKANGPHLIQRIFDRFSNTNREVCRKYPHFVVFSRS